MYMAETHRESNENQPRPGKGSWWYHRRTGRKGQRRGGADGARTGQGGGGGEVECGGAQDWPHSTSWYIRDPTGYQIEVVYWHHDEIRFAA